MKTMNFIALFLITTSVLLFGNCGGDEDEISLEGTNISMDDIAGSWTATYARFSNTDLDPPAMVNIVDEGGTVTLVIQSNGKFTFTTSFPGDSPAITTGQLGFDEDYLLVGYDDDPGEYEYMGIQLSTDHNQLVISGPAEYDFDDDGTEEPAQLYLELVRD